VSKDPIEISTGVNLYEYCGGTPVQALDAFGLQPSAAASTKSCGKTPASGVLFIPKRGKFERFSLGAYGAGEDDYYARLGSGLNGSWTWDQNDFIDSKGCCCCNKIVFVQIVSEDFGWLSGKLSPASTWAWKKDIKDSPDNLTYALADTMNPCTGSRSGIDIRDNPNALAFNYLGNPLLYLGQNFETCVVCLSGGPEGRTPTGITVYGCIKWGHTVKSFNSNQYNYSRHVEADTRQGTGVATPHHSGFFGSEIESSKVTAQQATFDGLAPSSDWTKLVL
jgi:hypothetical protein